MSVSAADRARYEEQATKTRDEYENRETDTVRRKNDEIKNAERRHQAEIRKLEEVYQNQLADLQRHSVKSLSDRDRQNNKEVEELKGLYMDQLRKKTQATSAERKALTESYQGEIHKNKDINESQKENLTTRQTEELQKRDQRLEEVTNDTRETMKAAIEENARKLHEAHEKETQLLVKEKQDNVVNNDLNTRELKKAYRGEIERLKAEKEELGKAWREKYYDTVKNFNDNDSSSQQNQIKLMQEKTDQVRRHFNDALEEKQQKLEDGDLQFRSKISDRIDTQVRSRDSEIKNLKEKIIVDEQNDARLRNLDKRNIVDSYESRMGDLEKQRSESLDHMNEVVHSRVNESRNQNEHLAREANKNYRSQMSLIDTRNREDRKGLEEQQAARLQHVENSTEKRLTKMQRIHEQDTENLSKTYDEAVDVMKDGYAQKVADQRDKNITERSAVSQSLEKRVRGIEGTYQNRLESLQSEHEAKLFDMRDQQRREIRRIESNYKNLIQDREKGHKTEKESIEQKYQAKIELMEEAHTQDKEAMSRKHEEDLKAFAQKYSNYSRKA